MQIISGLETFAKISKPHFVTRTPFVLTIGNFDGVHLGHQALIKSLVEEAHHQKAKSVILTFNPHPVTVLFPERPFHRMFDFEDQCEQLQSLGVDYLIQERFTKEFAAVSADDFLREKLLSKINPCALIVGYDFTFGKGRQGDLKMMKDFCQEQDIHLIYQPATELKGSVVSSSRIRESLKEGKLGLVRELLGRSYYLRGVVEKGSQRGKRLGIPTANLCPQVEFIPARGVYFSRTFWKGKVLNSITNIGVNPTFESEEKVKLETHIFDFDENLYGETIKVELLEFIRKEKKFERTDDLMNQIYQDMAMARTFFGVKN